MNVLVYSLSFLPSLGGLERNTLTLCSALMDLGHGVHLCTATTDNTTDISYRFDITRTKSIVAFAAILKKCDMLIVNGGISLRKVPIAFLWSKKYVLVHHTSIGWRREGHGILNRINNRLRQGVAEHAFANVFTSNYARYGSDLQRSAAYTILNPIDKQLQNLYERIALNTHESEFHNNSLHTVLFAGRFIEGKGVFILMNALERLDGRMHFAVIFAGSGPAEAKLKSRSDQLSTINVHFPGKLNSERLLHAYCSARVLVVPSSTHKEGNPLVLAEALSAGTPAITSDQPPMQEALGDAGLTFENGNAQQLANLLEEVLSDESAYEHIKENAVKRRKLFRYDAYVRNLKRIVGDVHAEQKAR